jgi:hypothetical protein
MRSLAFAWLSFFCSVSAFAQLHLPNWATDDSASEADLIRGITTTDSPGAAQSAYRILFKKVGADGVQALLTHKSDTIALRAAWEEVKLTVPEKEPPSTIHPDRHKLHWFIGFLEGRVRVKTPQWWVDAVVESKASSRDNFRPGMRQKQMYHATGLDSVKAPLNTTLEAKEGKLLLRIANESVSLPAELLHKSDDGKFDDDCVSAILTRSRCYFAVHDDVGYPYRLACIDRSSGNVKWKTDVWGSWIGGFGGQGYSWITVTEQEDRIIVFGVAVMGFHVEGFRADNGGNLFRVSNSF